METIKDINRLLSLPQNASDILGFRFDLGDGRELIVEKWTPSVTNDDQVVKVSIEGVIEFKRDPITARGQ